MIRPVNDFRIGNLVLNEDGELCKIEQLSSEKMECFQQVSNIENKSCISTKYPSNIYAIPLTEEWLLKAGFKEIKFLNEYLVREKGYKYLDMIIRYGIFDGHRFLFDFANEKCVNLKYVHQLQNLYFAICGEELVFSSTEP